jgi:hypothetical protein
MRTCSVCGRAENNHVCLHPFVDGSDPKSVDTYETWKRRPTTVAFSSYVPPPEFPKIEAPKEDPIVLSKPVIVSKP